jgi:predicted neuraminidase
MRSDVVLSISCLGAWIVLGSQIANAATQPNIARSEFIFETAPFRECHASTIAESKDGLVVAWFGGTAERNPDVGIWLSRYENGKWTTPREVANGVQSPENRGPCWNPVLFQPKSGPLMLFYKVGPSPRRWWGLLTTSDDGGKNWSKPRRLPNDIIGPIKNKPVQLAGGDILCPSSTEDHGWRVHFERTGDLGQTWQTTGPLNDGNKIGAIQPSVLIHGGDRLQAIGRTRQKKVFSIESNDGGKTWGEMTLLDVPNPNSGIDAVTLRDGRHLLVYNRTPSGRSPLNVAVSNDGKNWTPVLTLEIARGEFSYPAVIQTKDGHIHITYTWDRKRIRHIVLDNVPTLRFD